MILTANNRKIAERVLMLKKTISELVCSWQMIRTQRRAAKADTFAETMLRDYGEPW